MWIGVKHQKKEALELFTREIAPAGTGMGESFTTACRVLCLRIGIIVHSL